MTRAPLLLLLLVAAPLTAQSPRLGPAASPLFARAVAAQSSDWTVGRLGIPQNEAAFCGALLGVAVGYLLSTISLSHADPTCSYADPCAPPREDKVGARVTGTVIGAVASGNGCRFPSDTTT